MLTMANSLRGIASRARWAVRLSSGQEGETMSALHRLKAYFGMVPAEEFDAAGFGAAEYDDYHPSYPDRHHQRSHHSSYAAYEPGHDQPTASGPAEHPDARRAHRVGLNEYDDGSSMPAAHHVAPRAHPARSLSYSKDPRVLTPRSAESRTGESWISDPTVRGSLAIDTVAPQAARVDGKIAVDQSIAPQPRTPLRSDPLSHDDLHPLARIVTLHPHSYNEARPIGERFREGNPVIMNLTAMEDRDAKRLVDFAAGLAFALRGSIDKVTNKVFLLSPPNIDVSAEDRRRIAEGSLFN